MGIQGLIPFLKKASSPCNVKDFKGAVVAIDSYCWLHKGAFACAEKLALGEKTDQYVLYCMKYVNSLLAFGIKPIMVFDGCRLPSKKEVEQTRRDRRNANRKKAAQLLREGRKAEARDCLVQCIDITPHMALELIKACRARGVDCIVAPYEADAQLAYLNQIGLADVIITEDSDLILFGCDKILFKMDLMGNGLLVEKSKLHLAIDIPSDQFTFEKFQRICILSGCDYLPSLPGIGLAKATKVFKLSRQTDMKQVLKRLPMILKMPSLVVTDDYINNFFKAENTFLYQLVFDPLRRKLMPLNAYPAHVLRLDMSYAGPSMSDEEALQIALGNVNVNDGSTMAHYDPDDDKQLQSYQNGQSIWSKEGYTKRRAITNNTITADDFNKLSMKPSERLGTKGKEVVVKLPYASLRQRPVTFSTESDVTRPKVDPYDSMPTDSQLVQLYSACCRDNDTVHDGVGGTNESVNKLSGNQTDIPNVSFTSGKCSRNSDDGGDDDGDDDDDKENDEDCNREDSYVSYADSRNNLEDDSSKSDLNCKPSTPTYILSPKKCNVFAVNNSDAGCDDKKGGKHHDDVVNSGKSNSIIHASNREVKSRFFVSSPETAKESDFFVRLKENDRHSDIDHSCYAHSSSDIVNSPDLLNKSCSVKSKLSIFARSHDTNINDLSSVTRRPNGDIVGSNTSVNFHKINPIISPSPTNSFNSNALVRDTSPIFNAIHKNHNKVNTFGCNQNNKLEPLMKKCKLDGATPKRIGNLEVNGGDDYERESPLLPLTDSSSNKRSYRPKACSFNSPDNIDQASQINRSLICNDGNERHHTEDPRRFSEGIRRSLFSINEANYFKHVDCFDGYENESVISSDDIHSENPLASIRRLKGSSLEDNATDDKDRLINNKQTNINKCDKINVALHNSRKVSRPSGLSRKNSKSKLGNAIVKDDKQQTLSNFFHTKFSLNKNLQKFSL